MTPFPLASDVSSEESSRRSADMDLWLVLTILAVIVCTAAVLAGLYVLFAYKKPNQGEEEGLNVTEHQATRTGAQHKRSKLSTETIAVQQEHQREYIIRKSLSMRTIPQKVTSDEHGDRESAVSRQDGALKDDWKEWEAGLQQDDARSIKCHPGVLQMAQVEERLAVQPSSLASIDLSPVAEEGRTV